MADGADGRPGGAGDAFVAAIERFGAICLAAVAALTFVSVIMRYVLVMPIPDSFDFSRLLMGVLVLWGIAAATYRGELIQMDAVWQVLGPGGRRAVDIAAAAASLVFVALFAVKFAGTVVGTYHSGETTFDLGVALWPFYLAAWLGVIAATALCALRLLQAIRGR